MALLITSNGLQIQRLEIAEIRVIKFGVATNSSEITDEMNFRLVISLLSDRSSTSDSTSRPANGTPTRIPGFTDCDSRSGTK